MSNRQNFEWDENKRLSNIRKHGVDFLDMPGLFKNRVIEQIDMQEDYGEERMLGLGMTGGEVYRIVFTLRDTGVRIISAMKASKNEQKSYYRSIFD